MNFYRSMAGETEIRLTCADPAAALQAIVRAGIPVSDAKEVEDLTVTFRIPKGCGKRLMTMGERKGWQVTLSRSTGWQRLLGAVAGRPVLVFFLGLILGLSVYLPGRILFVRVEGNSAVPTRQILAQAESCGIGFGASRRAVRSQKMKDALLEAMPQLQWAGVNTSGCVATITVRERTEEPEPESRQVRSIVADRDGILTDITVTRGTGKKTVGQAVLAGEVLISGYTDCGFCIRAEPAEGEVFAQTERDLTAVTPVNWRSEGQKTAQTKKCALIIGKNRINFYKGSGISGSTCDKMYLEYYLTLPGGFRLPVCVVTEVWSWTDPVDVTADADACAALLKEFSGEYLSQQMTAGTVLRRREETSAGEGICCLTGKYACVEMIGRQRNEEIIKPNE